MIVDFMSPPPPLRLTSQRLGQTSGRPPRLSLPPPLRQRLHAGLVLLLLPPLASLTKLNFPRDYSFRLSVRPLDPSGLVEGAWGGVGQRRQRVHGPMDHHHRLPHRHPRCTAPFASLRFRTVPPHSAGDPRRKDRRVPTPFSLRRRCPPSSF